MCNEVVDYITSPTAEQYVEQFLDTECPQNVCQVLLKYFPVIWDLMYKFVESEDVCKKIVHCT